LIECFLSLGAATKKECQNLWGLGSTSELVNLTILAKKSLSLKFPEAKSQRAKMYLRGALDSSHFSSQVKINYLVWMPLGNFADI
jgi:hypothetical protein